MRNLQRDTQKVYIARYESMERAVDESGRLTGKNTVKRSEPVAFWPTVTMATGEAKGAYFGVDLDYDRVLTYDNPSFAVSESDVLWIDANVGDVVNPNPHDHVVKRVSRKGGYTVIAAKRVEVAK